MVQHHRPLQEDFAHAFVEVAHLAFYAVKGTPGGHEAFAVLRIEDLHGLIIPRSSQGVFGISFAAVKAELRLETVYHRRAVQTVYAELACVFPVWVSLCLKAGCVGPVPHRIACGVDRHPFL